MICNRRNWNKHRSRHRCIIILAAIVLVLAAAFGIYTGNYYRADAYALQCIAQPGNGVSEEYRSGRERIFTPDAENDRHIGLIFYPGGKVEDTAYAPLMNLLASRGITCILVHMPCNLAILDMNRADGIQEQFHDINKWYIGGHSLGGVAASMYLAKHAGEYDGLVLLGAYASSDLSASSLSVLSLYGENDGVMNRANYEKNRIYLPQDFTEYVIEGGCHAYFGSYGEQSGDGTASITPEEQQAYAADRMAEWMLER